MKYQIGLIVGRFQPFHRGHLSMIRQSLEICEQIKIMIGSANCSYEIKNPLTLKERLRILRLVLEKESFKDRVKLVGGLDDMESDDKWLDNLIKLGKDFQIIIGNDDLTIKLAEERGIEIFRPKLTKREIWQATIIRNRILAKKSWKELVPEYEVELLEQFGLEERLKKTK